MYRLCTTEKTATQQKQFTDTLLLLLQKQPYQEISISELCRNTGLSRNIFYRLFDSKLDVLHALIDYYCVLCIQMDSSNTPEEKITSFYTFWKKNKFLLDILDRDDLFTHLVTRGYECFGHLDIGPVKDEYLICFCTSAFTGLLLKWYRNDFSRSEEEMGAITYELVAKPIVNILNP